MQQNQPGQRTQIVRFEGRRRAPRHPRVAAAARGRRPPALRPAAAAPGTAHALRRGTAQSAALRRGGAGGVGLRRLNRTPGDFFFLFFAAPARLSHRGEQRPAARPGSPGARPPWPPDRRPAPAGAVRPSKRSRERKRRAHRVRRRRKPPSALEATSVMSSKYQKVRSFVVLAGSHATARRSSRCRRSSPRRFGNSPRRCCETSPRTSRPTARAPRPVFPSFRSVTRAPLAAYEYFMKKLQAAEEAAKNS